MNSLAIIDIIFVILILILTLRCALRGFIDEAFSMAALVLGLLVGVLLYKNGAAFIRTKIFADLKVLPEILAFIVLFGIVFLVTKVLKSILRDIIERVRLGGVDRFLGALFGVLEGFVLVALVLVVLTIQPLFNPEGILRGSLFAEMLLPLVGPSGSLNILTIPAKLPNV